MLYLGFPLLDYNDHIVQLQLWPLHMRNADVCGKVSVLIMAAEISLLVEGRGAKQPTASLSMRNPSNEANQRNASIYS